MEKIKCLICGKEVSNNNSYIGSHVKRTHNIKLNDYVQKYYHNITPSFKIEKCGFCENNAEPNFEINHISHEYSMDYRYGFKCNSTKCDNDISLLILKTEYNKKTFEHIGSNTKYLSLLHKKPLDEIIFSKSKGLRESTFTTSLPNFINKYGEELGTLKYKERNEKIGKGNTLAYYTEKFGNVEGEKRYDEYRKRKNKRLGASISKASNKIMHILDDYNIRYYDEYKYVNEKNKNGSVDFYLPDHNIIIEYYGSYWHCQPSFYKHDYYHKIIKAYAYEIWEKDKTRIDHIFKTFCSNITILIIWESTKFTDEYLVNLLNTIKFKNVIVEI